MQCVRHQSEEVALQGTGYSMYLRNILLANTKPCKIWCCNGGDYEECGLLGYKKSVRTSQEAHCVSATEPSGAIVYKIWNFHGGNYDECRLLGYENPVCTTQKAHYVSATEPSRIMVCKNWGFHCGDNEECRILGCKSQFLPHGRHISAAELSRLMLCKMLCSHGGDYEECHLLGCDAVFRRNISPPSSKWKGWQFSISSQRASVASYC
jgi:hypothetical protein